MAEVKFNYGTKANFEALEAKDNDTLYFLTDTLQIFKGAVEYTKSCKLVSTLPGSGQVQGVVYVRTSDFTLHVFNGTSYITQRGAEAIYTAEGQAEIKETIAYYMANARLMREGLLSAGFTLYGGVNAPYIWLETPDKMTSWEFFDYLLKNANVVGTPGSGFGSHGEGYFRLTAFGTYENTLKAIDRIKSL